MAPNDLTALELRLEALEAQSLSKSEKDTLRFLIKVTRAIEGTAWLGGWVIKIAPIFAALWFFWDQAMHWIAEWRQ